MEGDFFGKKLKCKHNAHRRFMVETPPFIHTQNTDIELLLKQWLDENGVQYLFQKPLEGITIVDFFIEPNICLYADGDYWHDLENTKKRDIRINKKLKSIGYRIIRLLGSDIKKGVRPNELL